MTLLSMAAWYEKKFALAVLATALSALLSWPFAALIGYFFFVFNYLHLPTKYL